MKKANCNRVGAIGFTLIELLVVVTIVAVITSVAIPMLLSIGAASKQSLKLAKTAKRDQLDHAVSPDHLPDFESLEMQMKLRSTDHRRGLEVYTRFQLEARGRIVVRGRSEGDVDVFLPFPKGTIEAWNVALEVEMPDGTMAEPESVDYSTYGIFWAGKVSPNQSFTADFSFVALGAEELVVPLPPAHRIRSIDLGLDASGVPVYRIPDFALQPTGAVGSTFAWKFTNLVSDSNVRIVLPGAESALGRLFLLFRLTAVAILLFGAGFWYLNEQSGSKRLENFGWGNFTLLASNYSLFFVVFGVIVYHGELSVLPAVAISAVSSLPLLVLHVSRILEFRFALVKVLPLANLTLGVVINGVYGGAIRDYIFIGLLIVSVAYLTVTYRPKEKSAVLAEPVEA